MLGRGVMMSPVRGIGNPQVMGEKRGTRSPERQAANIKVACNIPFLLWGVGK